MDFPAPGVRFLNINVSNFDAWKLDGIPLADAREALTPWTRAVRRIWQAGWGAQIERAEPPAERDPARLPGGVAGNRFVPESTII
jgi:3D-(3,5/4)-trihydroxycyclohexane-1,2-dione acylhydrolase (decyclizing)